VADITTGLVAAGGVIDVMGIAGGEGCANITALVIHNTNANAGLNANEVNRRELKIRARFLVEVVG
jgi:hypothetical protein